MKTKKMTVQYLIKMTPQLMKLIDVSFSIHLKNTGEYISKAEFVRNILENHCALSIPQK